MPKTTRTLILISILILFLPLSTYSQFLSTCEDSDSGNNPNQAGTLTLSSLFRTVTKRDFCSSGQLIEYFCNGNKIGFEIKTCPQGYNCYQGACVSAGQQTTPVQQPQNPPEVICPAVCRQMYILQQNQCTFTDCGSGCGPNNIDSFPTLGECQQRITNPTPQPPEQPRTNYEGPLRFYISPDHIDYLVTKINEIPFGIKLEKIENFNPVAGIDNQLSNYMNQKYKTNIIDYNKDGFNDLSTIDYAAALGKNLGRFYLFRGISKSVVSQQNLEKIGITNIEPTNVGVFKIHYWKDVDSDGYQDLILSGAYYTPGFHGYTYLYWNNRDGTFTKYKLLNGNIQFEDINGDSLPDLINNLDVSFNNGQRGFTAGKATGLPKIDEKFLCYCNPQAFGGGLGFGVSVIDLDNDNDNDIIFYVKKGQDTTHPTGLFIAQNNGEGNFQTYNINQITSGTPPLVKFPYEQSITTYRPENDFKLAYTRVLDFDGDGDKDINLAPYGVIYENLLIP